MYYNLTLHNQSALAEKLPDVEVQPRLRPVDDVNDYEQLKNAVREAVKGIPLNSDVIVGGLGQYQALIFQLPFNFYFVDMKDRKPVGLIKHVPFDRNELFEIENGDCS